MERDKTDRIIESHIVEAIVRKGEQSAVEGLKKIDSSDDLKLILGKAEMKHRRVSRSGALSRKWIAVVSVAAVVAVVLVVGFQPRYSTDELYVRWNEKVVYEPVVSRGEDEAQVAFEENLTLAMSGKTTEAIEGFIKITSDSDSEYSQDAIKELERIVALEGFFAAQAQELLVDVRRKIIF